MLREFSPGRLWVAEAPLRFYGVEVGTRMTVCRLSGGGLWLHSPVRLTEGLREELDRLGPVSFVVAPNRPGDGVAAIGGKLAGWKFRMRAREGTIPSFPYGSQPIAVWHEYPAQRVPSKRSL